MVPPSLGTGSPWAMMTIGIGISLSDVVIKPQCPLAMAVLAVPVLCSNRLVDKSYGWVSATECGQVGATVECYGMLAGPWTSTAEYRLAGECCRQVLRNIDRWALWLSAS